MAISGSIESLNTAEAPRHRLAPITAIAPICQLPSVQKNSSAAKPAPTQANPASRPFLLAVRSATAPSSGSSTADRIVENVMMYDGSAPGAIERPRTLRSWVHFRFLSGSLMNPQAACSATVMRYGANSTVATVVT